jgi:hypothetical protein
MSRTRSIPYWTTSVFSSAWLTSFWFTSRSLTKHEGRRTKTHSRLNHLTPLWLNYDWLVLESSFMLRPTVSRPVCLGIKHASGAYDQIFITVRQFRVCWFGAPSLRRGRVCRLQFLLALAIAVILGSESRGTRDHILLSHSWDFPFRRLLRLAGLRWRYSTQPLRTAPYIGYR